MIEIKRNTYGYHREAGDLPGSTEHRGEARVIGSWGKILQSVRRSGKRRGRNEEILQKLSFRAGAGSAVLSGVRIQGGGRTGTVQSRLFHIGAAE